MNKGLFASIAGVALAQASGASAVTNLSLKDLLPPDGYQHYVEIKFSNPDEAYFRLTLVTLYWYDAYSKWNGEYLFGNDLEGDESLTLDKGKITAYIYLDIYRPEWNGNTLSFWLKSQDHTRGIAGQAWGCTKTLYIRCEKRAYLTYGSEVVTDGQELALKFSRLSAVPEPAAWGMIIAGFGVVGWAARRQRLVRSQTS